uniref:uncharacterized protein At2g34460, chloroplastic isoform X2 n=1 Tax=Erigeron canadensis TaxID=72917 RepID=UPI001CB93C12|nr:uncharacterized protein At2g34460, chloroplastic isoform X2 [Erigeron canadensis]
MGRIARGGSYLGKYDQVIEQFPAFHVADKVILLGGVMIWIMLLVAIWARFIVGRRRKGPSGTMRVKADVTEGFEKLADAIGDDSVAVICATGFQYSLDVLAPWKVDYYGTINLVDACRKVGVSRFIFVSSILVNGAAMGQLLNPAYIVLNAFGLVLMAKLQAEQYIRKSGINYTIVRPGGLKNDPPNGSIVMESEDTLFEGSISRDQVAEVAVEALLHQQSSYKVVEIVARTDAPKKSFEDLFSSIQER